MKERIIKKENFISTKWSGGETSQLFIYPEEAIFSEKDFLWRISTATFSSKASKFSDFSKYQRYILPLEGEIKLNHKGIYERKLGKYDVDYFDGSWDTYSENTLDCRDYNFIVKSGKKGKLQILHRNHKYSLKNSSIITLFSMEDFEITIDNLGERRVEGFSLLILEVDKAEDIIVNKSTLPILLTEFII